MCTTQNHLEKMLKKRVQRSVSKMLTHVYKYVLWIYHVFMGTYVEPVSERINNMVTEATSWETPEEEEERRLIFYSVPCFLWFCYGVHLSFIEHLQTSNNSYQYLRRATRTSEWEREVGKTGGDYYK